MGGNGNKNDMPKTKNESFRKLSFRMSPKCRGNMLQKVNQLFSKCTQNPTGSCTSSSWSDYVEIYDLVQEIQTLEKDIHLPLPNERRSNFLDPFLEWLKLHHVEVNGVSIIECGSEGLGLKVCKELDEGEEIFRVPKAVCLCEESAKKSVLGPLFAKDPILKHMANVSLGLHLLNEVCNPKSLWWPYFCVLPREYFSTLYYTPDEMKLLKGSPVQQDAIKHFLSIARQYSYFYRILHTNSQSKRWPIKEYFSFDNYRWSVCTVMTRLNRIPAPEVGVFQLSLIPGWDMANHEFGKFSTDFKDESSEVICYAHRDFKENEQFKIYYGPRPNADFFMYNEFVFADNPDDSYPVRLGVSRNDPLFTSKVTLLAMLKLPANSVYPLLPGDDPISPGLMAFTRIFCMDEASVKKWESNPSKVSQLQYQDCNVSSLEERKTWNFLLTRISLLLASYPTTLEEDEVALDSLLPKKEKLIRTLVVEEKKILKNATNFIKLKIANLTESPIV